MEVERQATPYGLFSAEYRESRLIDLCVPEGGVQTGPFGSQLHKRDYVEVGTPIITVEHLGDNRILHDDTPKVSNADRDRLSRYRLRPGDIVFSRVGSVDRRALVREEEAGWLFSGRCLRVRPNPERINPTFLSYFFGLEAFKEHVRSIAVGATMPSINTAILSNVPVIFPHSIYEQQAIASILVALDDKVELNRRMSETQDQISRTLFHDWFVEFGPTHAKNDERQAYLPMGLWDMFPRRLRASELGPIPEDWGVGTIADLCDYISSGGTPARKTPEYWEAGTIDWFKTGELHDGPLLGSSERITQMGLDESSCKLWPPGTILFALYASPTVGRLGVLTRPGSSNQAAAGLIARPDIGVPYLMQALISARSALQNIAVGAAQQNINQQVLKSHRVIKPPSNLTRAYSSSMSPLLEKRALLAKESLTLTELRDHLLPKLISGELRIPEAEQLVSEVA